MSIRLMYRMVTGQTLIRDTEVLAGPYRRACTEFRWRPRLSELDLELGRFVEVSMTTSEFLSSYRLDVLR